MRALLPFAVAASVVMLVAPAASADETGTYTMRVTTIYGRPQKPAVTIEIDRVAMKLPPTTPTLAALSKIQDSAKKDPF